MEETDSGVELNPAEEVVVRREDKRKFGEHRLVHSYPDAMIITEDLRDSEKCKENLVEDKEGKDGLRRHSSGYYSNSSDQGGLAQGAGGGQHGKPRDFVLANKTNSFAKPACSVSSSVPAFGQNGPLPANFGGVGNNLPSFGPKSFVHVKCKVDTGLVRPGHGRQASLPAGVCGPRPAVAGRSVSGGKKSDPAPQATSSYTRKYSTAFKVPDLPTAGSFNRNSSNRRSLTRLFSRGGDKGGIKTPFGEVSRGSAGGKGSDAVQKQQAVSSDKTARAGSEEKRSQFAGKRSITSLSLFSSKKDGEEAGNVERSEVNTPKERKNSLGRLRAARSSLDLSSLGFGSISRASSKATLSDLKEEPNNGKSERKNDRAWYDLTRVWKDQTRDLPTDDMFHMMRKERAGRAKTVPSRLGSLEASSVTDLSAEPEVPPPPPNCHTPSTLKKTVHLLSPEVLTNWYERRKVENLYGPRRNSISNLFFHPDKKQSSPLIELRNGDKLRKSMLNLDELLMGEGGTNSLGGKGVQRSESAKVTNESKRFRTKGIQRSESARLLTMRQVPSLAPRQNSHPNLVQQTSYSLSSSSLSDRSLESPSKLITCSISSSDYVDPDPPVPPELDLSDLEADADPPDWRHSLSEEALARLSSRELKRQDVINELFHTERSHVRNLKVLDVVFRRPLLDSYRMDRSLVDRLFPGLDEVLAVHQRYNTAMKAKVKAGFPVGDICDILSDMFLGENGDQLMVVSGQFTKSQGASIEELKRVRARDPKLEQFLSERERSPACRRLQLQSILPCEHQRLVKYPLLLEQVANQVNHQKLVEIQSNLDTSGLDKMGADHPIYREYKNLDLTTHSMVYDGSLTMKLGDTKRVKALHVLLLEDCMMLLQKQGDKYQLKFHAAGAGNAAGEKAPTSDKRLFHSPIIKFNTMLVRPVATDKRAFYLLNTTDRGPQIYELLANGAGEREKWIKYITEASTAYKSGMPKAKSEPEALAAKAVDGTRRPASFRDKTSSPRLERPDRQNSSPPEGLNIPRKEDEEDNAPTTPKKRLQRVEILKIVDSTPMIEPSQVHVNTPTVLVADPVVTPFEKLRQKDEEVSRILEEKQRIISEILHIPEEDFETIADIASSTAEAREAREILLAALSQAKSLTHFVNSSLRVGEEDVVARGSPAREPSTTSGSLLGPAGDQLIAITASMNQHLTDLLAVMSERDEERELLRRQLAKSQDQIRGFFRSDSARSFPSQMSGSRPNSFISLESEGEDALPSNRPLSLLSLTESEDTAEEERILASGPSANLGHEQTSTTTLSNLVHDLTPTSTRPISPPLPSTPHHSSPVSSAEAITQQHYTDLDRDVVDTDRGQQDSPAKEWTPENEISCQ